MTSQPQLPFGERTRRSRARREARAALAAAAVIIANKDHLFSSDELSPLNTYSEELQRYCDDRETSAEALKEALSRLDHAMNSLADVRVTELKAKLSIWVDLLKA